jgi:hypothetical protein
MRIEADILKEYIGKAEFGSGLVPGTDLGLEQTKVPVTDIGSEQTV